MSTSFEFTRLANASGVLTKRISLGEDGKLIVDSSACIMGRGAAKRARVPSLQAFADVIGSLGHNEAIALGALRPDLPDLVQVVTTKKLTELNGSAPPDFISRTAGHIAYSADNPAFALLDYDTKGMPENVAARVGALGGFWPAVASVIPELEQCARVVRRSTSSGLSRTDTDEPIKGSDGQHVFVMVQDGSDVERFLRTLHDRCWLHGLGWMIVGRGGQILERSIVDRTVFAAERLVFEGAPILTAPLRQDPALRVPTVTEGIALDTESARVCLTLVEKSKLTELKQQEFQRHLGPIHEAKRRFVTEQAARLVEKHGVTPAQATRIAERHRKGILLPHVELAWDAEEFAGVTVGDILNNPEKYIGCTMADPLEGVAYGRCKAKVLQRSDGWPWIHSFAHGRTAYELRYDAAAIETKLRAAKAANIVDLFVKLLVRAEVQSDEEQSLRELVMELAGVKALPLRARVKAAKAEHVREQTEQRRDAARARRNDRRVQLPAPAIDQERLPVLRALDEVLTGSTRPVPPMRDLDGHPVEIRNRPPLLLHELTSEGSNQHERKDTRLPAPVLPLLTAHDRYTLAHEIETHLEFVETTEAGDRSVALPGTFVDHFMAYRGSLLPRVGAIVTAPLVMPDGTLLAPQGLDRLRKLVFQIEPKLMEQMPRAADCTPAMAGRALDYLASKWLCDVATDFTGKCVSVALALTILERVLLPERPAFFITAGKRGGGKTTLIMMLILAVTGKKPPAAAWSPNEEERRKAILAYLAEGLPAMVWDNIPLGSAIACPTLEKVLTAESYSDRILGQSTTINVPAFTVMTFTGNNIGPKGDMASRSLVTRLEVDRIDPENRPFTHSDPVAWTLDNRGTILRALYTILLANQQLHPDKQRERKTRFKAWWHLVGSAVENAAAELIQQQSRAAPDGDRYAEAVDFAKLFASVESDDEEGGALGDVLSILDRKWPGYQFQAGEVASFAEGDNDDAATLRQFFEPSTRRSTGTIPTVSARSVGKRLMSVVGAPVPAGDLTLMLTRVNAGEASNAARRASRFKVRQL